MGISKPKEFTTYYYQISITTYRSQISTLQWNKIKSNVINNNYHDKPGLGLKI